MINVLIVEDNPNKCVEIQKVLNKSAFINRIEQSNNLHDTRKLLENRYFDILILDLNIPNRIGSEAKPENSESFLKELENSLRLTIPAYIIGLTEFETSKEMLSKEFELYLWNIILYKPNNQDWEQKLSNLISHANKTKLFNKTSSELTYDFDLAIITALPKPELSTILDFKYTWSNEKFTNDTTPYYITKAKLPNKEIHIVAATCPQMGMQSAATLTMKLISNFRPQFIVMTGIAASLKPGINYGDILIASSSFDYNSGKITKDKIINEQIHIPDFNHINISRELQEELIPFISDQRNLDAIKREWKFGDCPNTTLNSKIGPLGTGASVIEDTKIIKNIKTHVRKLIGIDMETYGVYYAATNCSKPKPKGFLSIKSVSDFGDLKKNDKYQKYAAFTSSRFAFNFFEYYLNQF